MKRLVACCDGTWDAQGGGTNVDKTARTVVPTAADGTEQVVFYDAGVGAGLGWPGRLVAGATGWGLSQNVRDAYRFLAESYEPGDEVWLFGFSRGAYTARSVAGMVRKCGLVRDEDLVRRAYRLYRDGDHPDAPAPKAFRDAHSQETRITFIGVWDTVGALGVPWGPLRWLTSWRHGFHDVELSSRVDHARHAVAVDERRKPYAPTLWATKEVPGTVRQAWFAGVHRGVGGGYRESSLSDIAFRWMQEEAEEAGLAFDVDHVSRITSPDPAGRLVASRNGFWRLVPGAARRYGDPDHQPQEVHASVEERRRMVGYEPANLPP